MNHFGNLKGKYYLYMFNIFLISLVYEHIYRIISGFDVDYLYCLLINFSIFIVLNGLGSFLILRSIEKFFNNKYEFSQVQRSIANLPRLSCLWVLILGLIYITYILSSSPFNFSTNQDLILLIGYSTGLIYVYCYFSLSTFICLLTIIHPSLKNRYMKILISNLII